MQEIGKYKIKRPKFILFLDKDGTTDLEDKNLNNIFQLVQTMQGMVIFVTGRTVGDIEGELENKKIKMPEIIVGDNGAVICYTKTNELLQQKELEYEKVIRIVEEFIENGGKKDYIRFTNGMEVFASRNKAVEKYYRKNKSVKLCDDICERMQNEKHITKLVLTGKEEIIKKSCQFTEELNYWTDADRTKFPKKEQQNIRVDIAQKNINKGESVKWLVEKLNPECGYMCIGNGLNDMSMFEVAIQDGMKVAVMGNSTPGLLEKIQQYAQEMKKGKVEKVPYDKNLANRYILKKAKSFQEEMRGKRKNLEKTKRLPNVPRVKVKGIDANNISTGVGRKTKNMER